MISGLLAWLLTLPALSLAATGPIEASSSGPRFTIEAVHIGASDGRTRRGGCHELRGEAGQSIVGSGSGGSWSVVHGFWAGVGVANSDTVFFNAFEECGR
jgi:hypothetical protein